MDLGDLNALLARKPEMVNDFPSWLVRPEMLRELSRSRDVVIAEIAGRDSVAAVLAALDEHPVQALVPTIAYTGTEFGDWSIPIQKVNRLAERLDTTAIKVYPPIILGSPRFWWLLCGRPISHNVSHFGLSTPCLGCHLYFHALRIPLAKRIGASAIISGERENHDGCIKLNQIGVALDAYADFVESFDLRLLMPIRYVEEGTRVQGILGEGWEEASDQLQCVLRKNDQDADGNVTFDPRSVKRFFSAFALPVARKVVNTYLAGESLGEARCRASPEQWRSRE